VFPSFFLAESRSVPRPPVRQTNFYSAELSTDPTSRLLTLHPGLAATSRVRWLTTDGASASIRDWLILGLAGAVAACASTFLDFSLRIPGHAILRVVFPMVVGLALVPRRGAGCVMAAAAALTAGGLRMGGAGGEGMSLGALTSLIATGPLLDWTLRRVNTGWRLYAAFAAAGVVSNLLALTIRGGAKALGFDPMGAKPLSIWLPQAAVTYVVCGLLAGLISGGVWFYARHRGLPTREATG
jgi:hypothetical protein